MEALLAKERKKYHKALIENGILTVDSSGVPSNADKSSRLSVATAAAIARSLIPETAEKAVGQTSGAKFELVNMEFLANTFPKLQNLPREVGILSNWAKGIR